MEPGNHYNSKYSGIKKRFSTKTRGNKSTTSAMRDERSQTRLEQFFNQNMIHPKEKIIENNINKAKQRRFQRSMSHRLGLEEEKEIHQRPINHENNKCQESEQEFAPISPSESSQGK
jgi:hypothetical protein